MIRRSAPFAVAACAALASPGHAGGTFDGHGVHFVQASFLDCDEIGVGGTFTLNATIPDDGRIWTWAWFSSAHAGANSAFVSDGPFALAATVGDEPFQNLGSLLVGPSQPAALGASFDFSYDAETYADGVLVYESTVTARCEQGIVTSSAVESRFARPECGPPLVFEDCERFVTLPDATLRVSGLGTPKSKLTLKASGATSDLVQFQDPSLPVDEGGATTATCFYDANGGSFLTLLADAGVANGEGKPLWRRKASDVKVAQKFRDPKGEEGDPLRSLFQTAGFKTKLALTARDVPADTGLFTPAGVLVQQRSVSPRDLHVTCTEVWFPDGSIEVDAAKGTVKAKIGGPSCPGCP